MKIRHLLFAFFVFAFTLAAGMTAMTMTLYNDLLEMEEAQERRFSSYRLAEELRRSSDDLTRFARTFAVTGDERFARHFQQVLDIRNGVLPRPESYGGVYWDLVITGDLPEPTADGGEASSLEQRMMAAGLSQEEEAKLRHSQAQSDELVALEDVAMNAVRGRFADDAGGFTATGPPDRQMAIDLLHGESYHHAKVAIMQPLGEFLALIDQRTQRELDLHNRHVQTFLLIILATSALLVLGTLSMLLVLRHRLMRPGMALIGTVERISDGDLSARTGISGRDEVAQLAGAIDTMTGRLAAALDEARRRTEEVEQQANALENMDQGVAMYDADRRLLAWNRRFRDYLEMPETFLTGEHTFDDYLRYLGERGEFGDLDVEEVVQQRLALLAKPHTFERIRPDGSILEVQRHPVASGGFIAIYTDVTKRKRAETRLREDEARFRAIDATAPVALAILDRDTQRLRHVNPRFCELMDIDPADAVDETFQSLLSDSDDRLALSKVLSGMPEHPTELRFCRRDGREFWVAISLAPLAYRGEPALIASMSDITDSKRVESELVEAKQAAESASNVKSEFLANMSHELRTPLNAIIGYSEMLREDAAERSGGDDMIADLKKIEAAGRHLLGLINGVLDLSKIEAGQMSVYVEQVDIDQLINEVHSLVAPLMEKNSNTFAVTCRGSLGTIETDFTKLKQCLINLVSNAAKFTRNGRVALSVERRGASDGERICFQVADTGIGMTPDQLGNLFQAFSQADSSVSREYGGTGLGLAITRHFAQMLGGDIGVESEMGAGSTFTLTIPVRQPAADAAGKASGDDPVSDAVSADDARATILVVDDNAASRDLLAKMLERDGYHVVLAKDGEEAMKLAREVRPDVITLDVLMPRMDGWSVLTALKSEPGLKDIPVIMVTMVSEPGIGVSLGASGYVTKPVDRASLRALLKRFCPPIAGPVLVVDDDPDSRRLARHAIEQLGLKVVEAENGAAALAWLSDHPDLSLVLLDIMMPEMDGIEFLDHFRRKEEWRNVPVVVVTAKDLTAEDRHALEGLTNRIIAKGETIGRDLHRALREILNETQTQRRT